MRRLGGGTGDLGWSIGGPRGSSLGVSVDVPE